MNDIAVNEKDLARPPRSVPPNDATTADNVRQRVRRYIIDDLLLGTVGHVDDAESLSQSGILDSTGALELVAFLEESFAIAVADQDLTTENLDTIDGIVTLVERKRAENAVAGG